MRLIIADNCLSSYDGHYFTYDKVIHDYAQSMGTQVTIVGSSKISDQLTQQDITIIPGFRYGLEYNFPSSIKLPSKWQAEWNYYRYNQTLYQDLLQIQKQITLDSNTIVLFHTLSHFQIYPIVRWVESLAPNQRPYVGLLLRFTPYINPTQPSPSGKFYRKSLGYLENSSVRDRFRLLTDSELLVNDYRDFTNLPLSVLPIPHGASSDHQPIIDHQDNHNFPIRLTYLGNARSSKGFNLLGELFKKLRSEIVSGKITGEIQANVMFSHDEPSVISVKQLRSIPEIKLWERELTNEEYNGLLARADLVLLPYSLCYYHAQTSGILGEAIARGKPVIVPRGTWMAKSLQTQGSGLTFIPGDVQDLYETIIQAIQQYPQLKNQAQERASSWAKYHCPATFYHTLIKIFGL